MSAASPARVLFPAGDITMEGLDKDRQLQTGEIIIIVAVLLMWAGECPGNVPAGWAEVRSRVHEEDGARESAEAVGVGLASFP